MSSGAQRPNASRTSAGKNVNSQCRETSVIRCSGSSRRASDSAAITPPNPPPMIKTLAIDSLLSSLQLPARFAREPNCESGAYFRSGNHFNSSTMRASDAPDRRQSQSRAIRIRAKEGAEDSRQIFFADAAAIVFDLDGHLPARSILIVALTQSHDDGPVAVYGFNGVVEQPLHGVLDLRRVNVHDDRR